MQQENKKTSTNISRIVKQVKKEHFIKTTLFIATFTLMLIWISMVLATSISGGSKNTSLRNELGEFEGWNNVFEIKLENNQIIPIYQQLKVIGDYNPLFLMYSSELIGWYLLVLLSPMGFLGLLGYIAYQKNMITPQAIKKTVRKALQFNYLKQKDVEYVCDEIDYNIGIKERRKNGKEEQEEELI